MMCFNHVFFQFHTYAASSDQSFKKRWLIAEEHVEDLEKRLRNAHKRERRAGANLGSLLKKLQEKEKQLELLNRRLSQQTRD